MFLDKIIRIYILLLLIIFRSFPKMEVDGAVQPWFTEKFSLQRQNGDDKTRSIEHGTAEQGQCSTSNNSGKAQFNVNLEVVPIQNRIAQFSNTKFVQNPNQHCAEVHV